MKYLKNTINFGLTFDKAKIDDLVVRYINSYFVEHLDKKKFVIGYLFTLVSSAIGWKVILYATITLSTIEIT